MTREEAIERFNGIINAMSISIAQSKFYPSKAELDELCDMAIEALQESEINCVHCPHYHETEDDTGVHSHCKTHGRLIDADALSKKLCETTIFIKDGEVFQRIINDAPTVPVVDITQRDLCADISCTDCPFMKETCKLMDYVAYADRPHGEWISKIDTGTWMLECSVCGSRVQEEKYRIAVGEDATKCPYCGAELGLGGYLYDEYANRPSQRKGEDE